MSLLRAKMEALSAPAWLSQSVPSAAKPPPWAPHVAHAPRPLFESKQVAPAHPPREPDAALHQEQRAQMARRLQEVDALSDRFRTSLQELVSAKDDVLRDQLQDLTELALAIAKELALGEIQHAPLGLAQTILQLAQVMLKESAVVVRVSAEDFTQQAIQSSFPESLSFELAVDPSMPSGSFSLSNGKSNVISSLESRERAIRAALGLRKDPQPSVSSSRPTSPTGLSPSGNAS